ncbi:MAG TPA: S8 family serine peptidase, partial [Candidatus Hydrogenedentes bacterium]|nr:S8 family serine peptidase [Candidatus Hydrogenedentota bacterium]
VGQQYKYVARWSEHIVVAALDTGVHLYYGQGYLKYEDLNANQWFNENDPIGGGDDDGNGLVDDYYGWDFCDDDNVPFDESVGGHGTSSAGVVAGVTNNSAGIAGIAGGWAPNIPGCRIMPIRVVSFPCTATSLADVGAVTQGILYAADMGAHVLTMSLGVYDATQDLTDAVRYARACGSVLVAAAHNFDNYDDMGPGYPARYPEVICVGALNRRQVANDTVQRKFGSETQGPSEFGEDNRGPGQRYGGGPCIEQHPEDCNVCLDYVDGWGSNFGPQLDIMAPGMEIWTTDTSGALGHNDNQYANWDYNASENPEFWYNKTSSATPQVAGVVALVLSATLGVDDKPTLAPEQVQAILQFTADDMHYNRDDYEIAGPGRDIYTGYGRVNAEAAVQLAIAPRFVVHQEGQHALSIDSAGNLVLTGDLCESATTQQMTQTGAREFLIKEGANVILILKSGADLYLKGKLYEAADVDLDTALTEQSFRVRSTDGETVAAVNGSSFVNTTLEPEAPYTVPAGSLILRGRAFLATDPDRESSQGI